MARNISEIKDLARHAVNGTAPADFSASSDEINSIVKEEIRALAADYNTYRRNKYDIFEIIQEAADIVSPKETLAAIGQFAEIRQYANNAKPQFKVKKGRNRAKRFVTRAAASGVYRAFRLDTDVIDVNTYTMGTAAYIDFERFLSGDEDLGEVASIITESFVEAVYVDIQKALLATVDTLKNNTNKVVASEFNADSFAKLCATVKAYGEGAVIFAPSEFIVDMGTAITEVDNPSVTDIEDIRSTGTIKMFRGCPIVELKNSFVDETNSKSVWHPGFAYVLPAGKEKLVKVALVGDTHMKYVQNEDWSIEIQFYKKMGVALAAEPHYWGIYLNTAIEAPGWDNQQFIG